MGKAKPRRDLRQIHKSFVDKHSDYKRFIPGWIERSRPALFRSHFSPPDIAWSSHTLTNITESSGIISISGTNTLGTVSSATLVLIQSDLPEGMQQDIDYVKFTFDHVLNDGTVEYFASNDGSHFRSIPTNKATYRLPRVDDDLNNFQSKYNDLRFKILIKRTLGADTSPTVRTLRVNYRLT